MNRTIPLSIAASIGMVASISSRLRMSTNSNFEIELQNAGAVYISPSFLAKINALKDGGLNQLQLISDFDRTLTASKSIECHSIIGEANCLPILFRKDFAKFIDFVPHGYARSLSREQWWTLTAECMVEHQLNRNMLKQAVANACCRDHNGNFQLILRPMMKEMFMLTQTLSIPILIASAGLDLVISETLVNYGIPRSHVKIYANRLEFKESGNDGTLYRVSPSPGIYCDTKKYTAERCADYFKDINRPNIIFLGDKPYDASTVAGLQGDETTILKIGWLVPNDCDNKCDHSKYKKAYDLVFASDVSFEAVIKILNDIKSAHTIKEI